MLDPCSDPEPAGWEEFRLAEGLSAIWAYDVIAASSLGSWARPLLAVFRDGGRVVGVAGAVYVGLRSARTARPARPRREPIVLDVRLPGHSNGPTWHFSDEVAPETRRRLMREFERAARRQLGWGLAGVLYRMVTEPRLPEIARRGAISRGSPGTAVMPLRWASVDGWLASLGKGRRTSLRGQSRKIAAAPDLEVREGRARHDLDPEELAELNRRHGERLAARLDPRAPLPAAYFAALIRRQDVSVVSYHEGARLLAFALVYEHPDAPAYGPWAALRPDEGGRKDLYFDSYVRVVRRAVEHGGKRLFAGRGQAEVKRTLGFEPVPMHVVAVPRWSMG
ncbi:GNAT family N-acetyltransferase [Nonomuraea sp. NN258]|uniref:GNAT family N-acetyltransferase n=1 Tax=Nonomuraea antri TaxID=2730852 RepID=UPI001569F3C7|nr:GNAT family N-acetyltransferase [Nonomuraea antri]NRQ38327.1 GNAT family N-acetyltransferase [Nonomuraea antri]